ETVASPRMVKVSQQAVSQTAVSETAPRVQARLLVRPLLGSLAVEGAGSSTRPRSDGARVVQKSARACYQRCLRNVLGTTGPEQQPFLFALAWSADGELYFGAYTSEAKVGF